MPTGVRLHLVLFFKVGFHNTLLHDLKHRHEDLYCIGKCTLINFLIIFHHIHMYSNMSLHLHQFSDSVLPCTSISDPVLLIRCHFNTDQYIMISYSTLQWQRQNINHILNWHKAPHTSHSWWVMGSPHSSPLSRPRVYCEYLGNKWWRHNSTTVFGTSHYRCWVQYVLCTHLLSLVLAKNNLVADSPSPSWVLVRIDIDIHLW